MSRSIKVFVPLLVLALLVAGALVWHKAHAGPPINVKLRLSVSPPEQLDFVIGQARSAKLKYEVGKLAGLKPAQAQRASIKAVPKSSALEMQIAFDTREQGDRFADAFIARVQAQCEGKAQLAVLERSVH